VGWLEKYPRLSLVHRPVCARGKTLIAGASSVDSPGVIISLAGWAEPTLSPAHRPFIRRRNSVTPGAPCSYAPAIIIPKCRPSCGGPAT
jgi:hypothetical protein